MVAAMNPIPMKVQKVLDQYSLKATLFEKGSTPTAAMAAARLQVEVGQIAKSLLFVSKDKRFFLIICPGDRKVSSAKLKRACGTKTHLANPEETRASTGFSPGSVCPFGIEEIPILLDKSLQAYQTIYPAAGTDSSGVAMTYQQLASITQGSVFDLTDSRD